MWKPLLIAILLFAAACSRPPKAEVPASIAPRFGHIISIHQVVDKKTRKRLGFIEEFRYDTGQVLFWVRNVDRTERMGYITPANRAYKYVWRVGQRDEQAEFIGADTISSNARRILGYDQPVALEPITLEALAEETAAKTRSAAPEKQGKAGSSGGASAQ